MSAGSPACMQQHACLPSELSAKRFGNPPIVVLHVLHGMLSSLMLLFALVLPLFLAKPTPAC